MADIEQQLNGLGSRLNDFGNRQAGCMERTDQRLKQVEFDNQEKGAQITRIFQTQEMLNISMAEVKSAIRTWGAIIGLASPAIAAIIAAIISKFL